MPDGKYGDFFEKYDPSATAERNIHEPSRHEPDRHPPKKNRKPNKNRYLKLFLFLLPYFLGAVAIIVVIALLVSFLLKPKDSADSDYTAIGTVSTASEETVPTEPPKNFSPISDGNTKSLGSDISSAYGILVDCSTANVLAEKLPDTKIYPASMTKIMVLLVAAELNTDLNDTFRMTTEIIDPLYVEGSTMAGFMPGEDCRIEDLFYGSILESGGEATVALATHIAGSEQDFVDLMNKKAEILGLKNTHFANASGLHSNDHYTTCREMAIIMQAVLSNDFCRKVISTEYYTVPANEFHDELKFHSGMFEKMVGDEPEVATVQGGKTGYTVKAGNCLVSYAITDDGRKIICVTASGGGKYIPIYDCIKLYKEYTH